MGLQYSPDGTAIQPRWDCDTQTQAWGLCGWLWSGACGVEVEVIVAVAVRYRVPVVFVVQFSGDAVACTCHLTSARLQTPIQTPIYSPDGNAITEQGNQSAGVQAEALNGRCASSAPQA